MITNERQYRITKAEVEKFRKAIEHFDIKAVKDSTRVLARAELDALQSEYENLSVQVHEYEALKAGTIEVLKAENLQELPKILIRARIAKGLSQRQLAETIGLKEQQIQRYEAEEYASANLARLAEVAGALGLNISEIGEFGGAAKQPVKKEKAELAWELFPIKEMYRRNWFDGFTGSLEEALTNAEELVGDFVKGVLDNPVQSAARQRVRSGGIVDWYALLAWQCRIIRLAKKKQVTGKYKKKEITREWLDEMIHMSSKKDGPRMAVGYLLQCGIRLIIEPHLPQTHLDGAAFLLHEGPVIGMTIRYDRLDNFWFVLLHELIHIMKHLQAGKVESIFDNLDVEAEDIEREADELASDILVPNARWETALARYIRSKESIISFASELCISPAIVAGIIRREAKNYTILTDMVGQGKVRRLFRDIDFSY